MPWYWQSIAVPRPVVAATLAVLLVLVLLVSSPFGAVLHALHSQPAPAPTTAHVVVPTSPPPTPTPSPYPSPTPITPAIGSVPTTCPPGSPLVAFDPTATGPGVGGKGVWLVAGVFGGPPGLPVEPQATAHLGTLAPSDYTPFGWPVQVMVFYKPILNQTITLSGRDLHTGYALWFSPGLSEVATPTYIIEPNQPQGITLDKEWVIWFGVLYLPGAGCYTVQASGPDGGWTVHFSAGR